MKKTRKKYEKDYKVMIVDIIKSGKSIKSVSAEYGLRSELISRWVREHDLKGTSSFTGNGNISLTASEKEFLAMKKELYEVKMERDILKKAVGIFSKSDKTFMNS